MSNNGSSRKVGGANKGLGEAPKSCTRKEHENATNSIAKRGQGGTSSLFVCPLQGQGGTSSLFVCPLWGLGQRPNCFSGDHSKGKVNKGAGSEASLPVTLRFLRSAPQAALFNVYAVSRSWRDRTACLSDMAACFRKQGFRACGRESVALRSPPTPLRSAHPCGLTFIATLVCASADAIMPCRNGFADV